MKCPLLCAAKISVGEVTHYTFSDCLKEECAWWDATVTECCIRVLASMSVGTRVSLHNIAEAMPFKVSL